MKKLFLLLAMPFSLHAIVNISCVDTSTSEHLYVKSSHEPGVYLVDIMLPNISNTKMFHYKGEASCVVELRHDATLDSLMDYEKDYESKYNRADYIGNVVLECDLTNIQTRDQNHTLRVVQPRSIRLSKPTSMQIQINQWITGIENHSGEAKRSQNSNVLVFDNRPISETCGVTQIKNPNISTVSNIDDSFAVGTIGGQTFESGKPVADSWKSSVYGTISLISKNLNHESPIYGLTNGHVMIPSNGWTAQGAPYFDQKVTMNSNENVRGFFRNKNGKTITLDFKTTILTTIQKVDISILEIDLTVGDLLNMGLRPLLLKNISEHVKKSDELFQIVSYDGTMALRYYYKLDQKLTKNSVYQLSVHSMNNKRLFFKPHGIDEMAFYLEKYYLVRTPHPYQGQSGSPVLNKNSQIIGLFSGYRGVGTHHNCIGNLLRFEGVRSPNAYQFCELDSADNLSKRRLETTLISLGVGVVSGGIDDIQMCFDSDGKISLACLKKKF